MRLRRLRTLAVLLLAAPLQAQVVRPSPLPAPVVEVRVAAPLPKTALAPLNPSPISPLPLLSSPLEAPTLSVLVAPEPAPVPAPGADAAPADAVGRNIFDGARLLHSDAGAVFAPFERPSGSVRLRLLERAPSAAPRPVGGTEGLSGRALLGKVSAIAAQGQREKTYADASNYLFSKADNVVIKGVRGVVDAYSSVFVPGTSQDGPDYPEPGDSNGDGHHDRDGMNVEHTWPQSLFDKALPMRSDLHHLMATFQHPNSVRAALPFGVVRGAPEYENRAGAKRGGGVFEPPDAVKGRVARGLLYFYARYRNSGAAGRANAAFWNGQIEILLRWNREFPPDAFEARRNDLVEAFQGNRNPFVDDPGLADRIGAAAFRAGSSVAILLH